MTDLPTHPPRARLRRPPGQTRETGAATRLAPALALPLALAATVLAGTPWLRTFPSDVMAVPLIGTAVLSVLLPVVVVSIGVRWLWLTVLIDVVGFVFFTTLVTLRDPFAVGTLWDGLLHGPSQILTFALPLVSPRSLLVAPIALCWACGAVIGECIGRGWNTVVAYAAPLATFGLAYAATTRGIADAGAARRHDTVMAGALLLVLLLLRAVQAWQLHSTRAEDSQGPAVSQQGTSPVATLSRAAAAAVAVALVAALVVQSSLFAGPSTSVSRTPPLNTRDSVTPLSFVAGLRPQDTTSPGTRLFGVSLDQRSSRYVALADLDTYDGDGWRFEREFRPSGGVVPADSDPALRSATGGAAGAGAVQHYTIAKGPLAGAPWLPFLYRPSNVDGVAVNIDASSGMIVPRAETRAGSRYEVVSRTSGSDFATLPATAVSGTSTPELTLLPAAVRRSIGPVVTTLQNETGTQSSGPLIFLRAVQRDLRKNYALSGGPSNATASPAAEAAPRTGGTGFAGVLASILGPGRSATPEQYATLVALLARARGVPARVVTGFRLGSGDGSTVAAGSYTVRSAQAWTWVEVPIDGRGWVVLDATPTTYADPLPRPSVSARPSPSPTPSSTNPLVTQVPSDRGNAAAPRSSVPEADGASARVWLWTAAAVLIALAALVLTLSLRKVLRRRRRRRGGPAERLTGAWAETLDALDEAGVNELEALTAVEVAAAARERFGPEVAAGVEDIGTWAEVAIFSPASAVDDELAARARATLDDVRRRIRARQTTQQRLVSALRYRSASEDRLRAHPIRLEKSLGVAQVGGGPLRRRQVDRPGPRHRD